MPTGFARIAVKVQSLIYDLHLIGREGKLCVFTGSRCVCLNHEAVASNALL